MPIAIILFVLVIILSVWVSCDMSDLRDRNKTLEKDNLDLYRSCAKLANRLEVLEDANDHRKKNVTVLFKKLEALEDHLNIHYHNEETLPAKYVKNK